MVVVWQSVHTMFRAWVVPAGVKTMDIAPFLMAPSRLLSSLRDTPGEIPDHFDRAVAALRCRALPEGTTLEASARQCSALSPFTSSGALLFIFCLLGGV